MNTSSTRTRVIRIISLLFWGAVVIGVLATAGLLYAATQQPEAQQDAANAANLTAAFAGALTIALLIGAAISSLVLALSRRADRRT